MVCAQDAIEACCNFLMTDNLGRHLDVPIPSFQANISGGETDKVKVQLNGRSTLTLSLVGRVALEESPPLQVRTK